MNPWCEEDMEKRYGVGSEIDRLLSQDCCVHLSITFKGFFTLKTFPTAPIRGSRSLAPEHAWALPQVATYIV